MKEARLGRKFLPENGMETNAMHCISWNVYVCVCVGSMEID